MKSFFLFAVLICFVSIKVNSQSMNITYKTISNKSEVMNYSVNATYPQVDFGPEALMGVRGIAQDINNSLDTTVNRIIQSFKNDVSQLTNKTAMNGMGSSLEITSTAEVISGTFLSAQIKVFTSVAGAAHPITMIYPFNYSTTSIGLLSGISDLFLPNSDYLNYISSFSISNLRAYAQKEGYTNIDDMITQGASPDIKNFDAWNITADNLVIIFNPYQVAPYVFGIQTVSIPLSNMTDMIDPKGPLSFMFR